MVNLFLANHVTYIPIKIKKNGTMVTLDMQGVVEEAGGKYGSWSLKQSKGSKSFDGCLLSFAGDGKGRPASGWVTGWPVDLSWPLPGGMSSLGSHGLVHHPF